MAGRWLKTTARWIRPGAAWANARDDKFADGPRDPDRAHDEATTIVADLIVNYAGNYSKLILDPDLDSYWLMDALVIKLPALGNGTARLSASAVLSPADSPDAVFALAGDSRLIEVTASDLETVNLATAIKETKNFGQSRTLARLSDPMEQLSVAIGAARQAVHASTCGPPARPTTPARWSTRRPRPSLSCQRAGGLAIAPELDGLVDQRVATYRGRTLGRDDRDDRGRPAAGLPVRRLLPQRCASRSAAWVTRPAA